MKTFLPQHNAPATWDAEEAASASSTMASPAQDPAVDPKKRALTIPNSSQASIDLPARTPRPRPGPSRANSAKARRRSEADEDIPAHFQRLAFVTVMDPAQLKDRANRKIEHVHSKREYFRRKRLKSLQQAREEGETAPSKPKEIAINMASHPHTSPITPQIKHPPSEICSGKNRLSCSECREIPSEVLRDDEQLQKTSRTAKSNSPTIAPHEANMSSFAISLHHQTNILNAGSIDPFGSYAVQSNPEIGLLMDSFISNFSDSSLLTVRGPKLPLNFRVIFQLALTDFSLFNSLMYLGSGSSKYHAEAIRLLNQKLKDPRKATDNASMIAILIWSDLSISGGNDRPTHDSNMRGLRKLLQLRNQSHEVQESLSERGLMERGILWADLAGASLMGAPRFFAHDAFSTVKLLPPPSTTTALAPQGFRLNAAILGVELINIIEEICEFRAEIESQSRAGLTFDELSALDDRKASIEWRLTMMQDDEVKDGVRECCRLAIHMCSSAIFPAFFGPSKMPTSLSQRLNRKLSQTDLDTCWNQHIDLLLWVLFIGASRAKNLSESPIFTNALRVVLDQFGTLCGTWDQTVSILETFIWSDKVFGESCKNIWYQTSPFRDST